MSLAPLNDMSLPAAFDVDIYRAPDVNPDLAAHSASDAIEHYANHGREEGRVCSVIDRRRPFVALVSKTVPTLEIGPFYQPALSRQEFLVSYLDAFSTLELIEQAEKIEGAAPDGIPHIDFVWKGQSYRELMPDSQFAAAFSAHNIEHQPNLVGHLIDVASVLMPGGRFFLAIPDKRYCFDHYRSESRFSDILGAHIERRTRHTASDLIEMRFLATHNDHHRHWNGDSGAIANPMQMEAAARLAAMVGELEAGGDYVDCHAWRFTPRGFADAIHILHACGLSPFYVERLYPTVRGSNEFYAVLKLP
jgi:hypothetical protein